MFSIGPSVKTNARRWNESLFIIFHQLVWIFASSQNHSIFVSFISLSLSLFLLFSPFPLFCVHFYIARSRGKDTRHTETVAGWRTMERPISAAIETMTQKKIYEACALATGAAYRWKSIEHRFIFLFLAASDKIVLPWATVFQKFSFKGFFFSFFFFFFFFIDSNVLRSSKLEIVALVSRWEKMKDICSTARNFFYTRSLNVVRSAKNTQIF